MIARILLSAASLAFATAALAAPPKPQPGDPVKIGNGLTLDPIIDGRLRYEQVDQSASDADAVTLRLRAGVELKHKSGLGILVEAVGTLGIINDYNALPFVIADGQRRPGFAVVADPMTIGLNRLQVQYKSTPLTVTLGRQRINLDDQRFVGSVGWRQNEQTFDAARVEALLGPVSFDGTYSISQRTVFGVDAGPRTAYDGKFVFLSVGAKLGPVSLKGFSYLLDYDAAEQAGALALALADTQTYGVRATGSFALGKAAKLNLAASYARQSNWQQNPVRYGADYFAAEASIAHGPFALTGGMNCSVPRRGRDLFKLRWRPCTSSTAGPTCSWSRQTVDCRTFMAAHRGSCPSSRRCPASIWRSLTTASKAILVRCITATSGMPVWASSWGGRTCWPNTPIIRRTDLA